MQIVIDIDEYEYKRVKELVSSGLFDYEGITPHLFKSVVNGTPLPKGHGRLTDADELHQEIEAKGWFDSDDEYCGGGLEDIILNAPTIIEADKENK